LNVSVKKINFSDKINLLQAPLKNINKGWDLPESFLKEGREVFLKKNTFLKKIPQIAEN